MFDKEELIKSIIQDLVDLEKTTNNNEKDTIKSFLEYKLKYLTGLIKEM